MAKCIYCGKEISKRNKYAVETAPFKINGSVVTETVYACCDEHTDKSKIYYAIYKKWHTAIALLQLLSLVGVLIFGTILSDVLITCLCMTVFGTTLLIVPTGTQASIARQGIKKMKIMNRVLGTAIVVLAIFTFFKF